LTDILGLDSQKSFQFYFFKNPVKAFGSGLIATATIRSSTITTSLVVPFVAKKLIPLRDAAPFILGANIGTTVTAFIAAAFNSNSAISIAVAHFLFNLFGVVLFLFPPYLKEVPLRLALGLGKLTRKYRLIGLLYILMVFFIIPFSLIYLHKDQTSITELTYEKINHSNLDKSDYILIIRDRKRNGESTWMIYDKENKQNPNKIISVLSRGNILFINDEIYEFGSPGFCRTNPRNGQPYEVCVEKVIPSLYINTTKYDSVYVFNLFPVSHQAMDSTKTTIYFSRTKNFPLKKERFDKDGSLLESEELVAVEIK
ncbi:MAG: Na/Pi symporter, partial [Cyclobacteriaceae bacterium]